MSVCRVTHQLAQCDAWLTPPRASTSAEHSPTEACHTRASGLVCDAEITVTKASNTDVNGDWELQPQKHNGESRWALEGDSTNLLQWKGAQWRMYVTATSYYFSDHAGSPALTGWQLGPGMVPTITCLSTPTGHLFLVHPIKAMCCFLYTLVLRDMVATSSVRC